MIFTPPRFVVVDDKEMHLKAIVEAFKQLGAPCVGIQFKPETGLECDEFRGVRALFLDLHLVNGAAKTDNKADFATIAQILEDKISRQGGPFILIIWTEHPHLEGELTKYLNESLDKAKPYARPLTVIALAKREFLQDDGNVRDPEKIRSAVCEALTRNAQLAALLHWESEVMSAAGDTLASLIDLVPDERRSTTEFPNALDEVLSRLACETIGAPHVDGNHRFAITTALAPILADRILNQVQEDSPKFWESAITQHGERGLAAATLEEAGKINRMLHLAAPGAESMKPTDWGVIVNWPYDWTNESLVSYTEYKISEMLGGEFHVEKQDRDRCIPVLIRVGATCDHAQKKKGPIKYLFGFEIPCDVSWKTDSAGLQLKKSDAIWRSPVFSERDGGSPFRLYVHARFPITTIPANTERWKVRYRVRDQLLMQLLIASSSYDSRPGIVQLPISAA